MMLIQKQIDAPQPAPNYRFYRGLRNALLITAIGAGLLYWWLA